METKNETGSASPAVSVALPDLRLTDYQDYRAYLRDTIENRKRILTKASSSIRAWARRFGFPNHTHLLLILKGERSLPISRIEGIGKRLQLSPVELEYFETLVRANDTQDLKLRGNYQSRLEAIRTQIAFEAIKKEELVFLRTWENLLVLEVLRSFPEGATIEVLKSRFILAPTSEVIETALRSAERINLVTQPQAGVFKVNQAQVLRLEAIPNSVTRSMHKGAALLAAKSLEATQVWGPHHKFISTSLSLNTEQIRQLKTLMDSWNAEALSQEAAPTDAQHVMQLNLQLFPVTKNRNEGGAV